MSEKEKKEIAEMVETAKHLAVHDPQAFMIAKSNMEILKIRADMDKQEKELLCLKVNDCQWLK